MTIRRDDPLTARKQSAVDLALHTLLYEWPLLDFGEFTSRAYDAEYEITVRCMRPLQSVGDGRCDDDSDGAEPVDVERPFPHTLMMWDAHLRDRARECGSPEFEGPMTLLLATVQDILAYLIEQAKHQV